jgi:hypothetical protein
MTYERPQLLLVGAAQNLVLGSSPEPCVGKDQIDQGFLWNDDESW